MKLTDAKEILQSMGLPAAQQNDISAYTRLALARIGPTADWSEATAVSLTIRKGIMDYVRDEYGRAYAENTRETVRRQVIHQFEQAGVVVGNPDAPDLPTNSPRSHYRLTNEALAVIRAYGSATWQAAVQDFVERYGSLLKRYAMERAANLVPVDIPAADRIFLSPGAHNELERDVVTKFMPRFASQAKLVYLGDAARKAAYVDRVALADIGIDFDQHDKLPDVLLYDPDRRWLFLIEAVTSHGPVSPKRVVELRAMFEQLTIGLVFVSAFSNRADYRKHQSELAWETEVWMAEEPAHLVHYDGEKFLGPYGGS
jgi:type II restriction enzyme